MSQKLTAAAAARKYAEDDLMSTTGNIAGNIDSTPEPVRPSFLAHISKPIGRKRLCFELRISKKLLDMWISGERKDPIERVRDIMRVGAKTYPDLPLHIAQELVEDFGGVVTRKLAAKEE
jgi:hypothetical protein